MNNNPQPRRAMTGAGYGGAAGAAAIVLAWVSSEFYAIDMPSEIVASIAVLISWGGERLGGYLADRTARAHEAE